MKQITRPGLYFPNLNAIRFFAALLVIIHHTEQFRQMFGLHHHFDEPAVQVIGKLGVVLFFVLSGFLISYLLFTEQRITGTIHVRKFYMRRILRVWPLYFLIILLSLFIFPLIDILSFPDSNQSIHTNDLPLLLTLYVFLLPNLVNLIQFVPFAAQTWSIGAEEQFYLFWPILNKKIKNKRRLLWWVIVAYLFIKFAGLQLSHLKGMGLFNHLWESTPFDCMAIGGLFALMLSESSAISEKLKKVIFSRVTQWSVLLLLIALMLKGVVIPYLHYEFYSVFFGILIVNFAANKDRIFSLENRIFNYAGKISYGIYMFHPLAIVLAIRLLQIPDSINDFVLYPLILLIVFGISFLSYHFFERSFLRKKENYSEMITGDAVAEQKTDQKIQAKD